MGNSHEKHQPGFTSWKPDTISSASIIHLMFEHKDGLMIRYLRDESFRTACRSQAQSCSRYKRDRSVSDQSVELMPGHLNPPEEFARPYLTKAILVSHIIREINWRMAHQETSLRAVC